MDWFRSHHGAPTDSKWLLLARRAGTQPGVVAATWWALMDYASQNEDRGSVKGFDAEEWACFAGWDEDTILGVIVVLQEKGLIKEDGHLAAWDRRQPKREDDSRERVRAFRQRQKGEKRDVTHGNAPEQSRGDGEETRTEENGNEATTTTSAGAGETEDDVNAAEARVQMWADFDERIDAVDSLTPFEKSKAEAAVRGIINGDTYTAWQTPTGARVPWIERPRLFRMALDERIASGGSLHNILRGLVIPREYDPFPVTPSTAPKPGTEAERVAGNPRAETPGRGRGRTTASEDASPRQHIPTADEERAAKERREREEAEQRQREDAQIHAWERSDEVRAKRLRSEAVAATEANKFVPAHLKERTALETYRRKVLELIERERAA